MSNQAPRKGVIDFWRKLQPFLGATTAQIVSLVVTSALLGFAEAGALVLMMQGAVAITGGRSSVEFVLGVVGTFDITLPQLFVGSALLLAAVIAGRVWTARLIAITSSTTLTRTRGRLFRAFVRSSWDVQAAERAGHLQETMTTNIDRVSTASLSLAAAAAATFQFLALMVSALLIQPVAATVIVASVGLLYLAFRPLSRSARRMSRLAVAANADYASEVTDVVAMTLEIRTFNVADDLVERVGSVVADVGRLHRRQKFLAKLVPALYQNAVLVVVLLGLVAIYVLDIVEIAQLGAVVLILVRALTYTQIVQVSHQVMNDMTPYLEAVQAEVQRYEAAASPTGGTPLPPIERLSFQGVTFAYGRNAPALRDITFNVDRGEAIGIVGPSGSGKSTFIQLLLRLRAPQEGALLVNGLDARSFSVDDWFQRVALVPQEARLAHGTVEDNVRFYRDLTKPDLDRAVRLAHIAEDIDTQFPAGWSTDVGERGGGALSGGQRQRLCIARALAGRPDLLILDEPTSALDMRSEELIRESFEGLKGQVTIFVIAHRLSTLSICDRIMVLDHGRLAAFGTAEELLESNPFFIEAQRLSRL